MKKEKLVYSTPAIKVELVEEDILTWSETTGIPTPEITFPGEGE